jgi:hypothetical protein
MTQPLTRAGIIREARRDAFGYLPEHERHWRFNRSSNEENR